jgi:hypothetical protein
MVTIRCQNRFKDKKHGKCGRILGVLTDMQISMLSADDEKGPIFRCPQCAPEQKWSQIKKDKSGKLIFEVIKEPDEILSNEAKFDDLIIFEQVG